MFMSVPSTTHGINITQAAHLYSLIHRLSPSRSCAERLTSLKPHRLQLRHDHDRNQHLEVESQQDCLTLSSEWPLLRRNLQVIQHLVTDT